MAYAALDFVPRIPRELVIGPEMSFHKIWRGHNREWNLALASEKKTYLAMLNDTFPTKTCHLYALCLMSNHTHEIYQTEDVPIFSHFMRRHHMRYGLYFNRLHDRCGKVAQDRPKTHTLKDNDHEMCLTFYIHANPLRAHMVKDAKNYPWSTYRFYAYGIREKWMKHCEYPEWYLELGKKPEQRQKKYRQLFDQYLKEQGLIRQNLSLYGIGTWEWVEERKRAILLEMKHRYGPSG